MVKLGHCGLPEELEAYYFGRGRQRGGSRYDPPEALDGRRERKSDVWSLGVSLVEMADGKNPFERYPDYEVKSAIRSVNPSLSGEKWSAAFVDFVSECLVKDVSERRSVSELMNVSVVMGNDE